MIEDKKNDGSNVSHRCIKLSTMIIAVIAETMIRVAQNEHDVDVI